MFDSSVISPLTFLSERTHFLHDIRSFARFRKYGNASSYLSHLLYKMSSSDSFPSGSLKTKRIFLYCVSMNGADTISSISFTGLTVQPSFLYLSAICWMMADLPQPDFPVTITRFWLFVLFSTALQARDGINHSLSCSHCSNIALSTGDSDKRKNKNAMYLEVLRLYMITQYHRKKVKFILYIVSMLTLKITILNRCFNNGVILYWSGYGIKPWVDYFCC